MKPLLHRVDNANIASVASFRASTRTALSSAAAYNLRQLCKAPIDIAASKENHPLSARLSDILNNRSLSAVFQPIVNLRNGDVFAYEGLIRGPQDSPLHLPCDLFNIARQCNLASEVEKLCREVILSKFVDLALPGKLFLNISPECLIQPEDDFYARIDYLEQIGISPNRIVLELTENQATIDYGLMRNTIERCRGRGFQIAIDDLGEGFSSLRLWSEIRPDYVKIDMHFIQGIDRDPVKLQFVQSIQLIAEKSGTLTIAEGIETEAELLVLQDLGLGCGQGYFIERPTLRPGTVIRTELAARLKRKSESVQPNNLRGINLTTALKLLRIVPVVNPGKQANEVYDIFTGDPELQVIAVVENGIPIGTISRFSIIDRFARPYQRELFGKRSCTLLMNPKPLVFDKNTSLQDLSLAIVDADPHHLSNGFAITDGGHYIGMGTGHDVMREITQLQISAARYANPLTQLPGNVPINEEIDRLILTGNEFVICYADIDNFKPFNDIYGYRNGDDVIQLTGNILSAQCMPNLDFLGHIGGDDFIMLFQSADWESRSHRSLQFFSKAIIDHHTVEDRLRGGYMCKDRQGKEIFQPLISLSLGAVKIAAGSRYSSYQIAAAATEAKKQAKAIPGNSLFIERRNMF
jgi:diguanylate cyclase (GGDEF)-like protein